jgi:DNA adenine methylase
LNPAPLRAPFPYFGGKRRCADVVWRAFGDCPNYVEPFAGSLAVLLARPHEPKIETVNDIDRMVSNFWRAVTADPVELARWADWPVSEADMHARHRWLVSNLAEGCEFRTRMHADPDFFDVKIAGWWVWGICQWIGSGWCVEPNNGKHPKSGSGVHASAFLRDAGLPALGNDRGINGVAAPPCAEWFLRLQRRLRRVRVACGDWTRVLGPSVLGKGQNVGGRRPCAVFLDPPYSHDLRDRGLYAEDDAGIAEQVRQWAIQHGDDPELRIALCGYAGPGHEMPASWTEHAWKGARGYAGEDNENRELERIWCSPHCLPIEQQRGLFGPSA